MINQDTLNDSDWKRGVLGLTEWYDCLKDLILKGDQDKVCVHTN